MQTDVVDFEGWNFVKLVLTKRSLQIPYFESRIFSKLIKFIEFTSGRDHSKIGFICGAIQSRKLNVSILLLLKMSRILKNSVYSVFYKSLRHGLKPSG